MRKILTLREALDEEIRGGTSFFPTFSTFPTFKPKEEGNKLLTPSWNDRNSTVPLKAVILINKIPVTLKAVVSWTTFKLFPCASCSCRINHGDWCIIISPD